jgi:ribosome biogenesis GTPase
MPEESPLELHAIGWNSRFSQEFDLLMHSEPHADRSLVPGRVGSDNRHIYTLLTEKGELTAEVSGRFRSGADAKADFPVVGDWVAASARPEEGKAVIHAVLSRSNSFSRRSAGFKTEEQVVAANIDTAFIVTAADGDFNTRRVERYLTLAWNSGAKPIVVLNKIDLSDNPEELITELHTVAFGVPILKVSAENGQGLTDLFDHLGPGETAALLGSSGVDHHQPPARLCAAGNVLRARRRQPRQAHHDAPRAHRAPGRGHVHRQPRHARGGALGG